LTAELVAEALMRRVIDAAIQAPSSGYRQPWITKESGMCR
jgi:nitroreductase